MTEDAKDAPKSNPSGRVPNQWLGLSGQALIVVLIVMVVIIGMMAGSTDRRLSDFKQATNSQIAQLREDFDKQAQSQQKDSSEIKALLNAIRLSTETSKVRLEGISAYYSRAESAYKAVKKK